MTQELAEGISTRLMDYYKANIAAKVTSINAEYNVAQQSYLMKAPGPKDYYDGEIPLVAGATFPKLFVFVEQMVITAYNQNYTDAYYPCTVQLYIKGTNTSAIQTLMYRWGKALWEMTVARYFATTADNYFMLHDRGDIKIEYQRPPAFEVPGPYYGKVILTFNATRQENVNGS